MKIELTKKQMEAIDFEKKLIVDNEEWIYVCQDGERIEDENGSFSNHIYKRSSDNKFFRVPMVYYKRDDDDGDYSYEIDMKNNIAYEIETNY